MRQHQGRKVLWLGPQLPLDEALSMHALLRLCHVRRVQGELIIPKGLFGIGNVGLAVIVVMQVLHLAGGVEVRWGGRMGV